MTNEELLELIKIQEARITALEANLLYEEEGLILKPSSV